MRISHLYTFIGEIPVKSFVHFKIFVVVVVEFTL